MGGLVKSPKGVPIPPIGVGGEKSGMWGTGMIARSGKATTFTASAQGVLRPTEEFTNLKERIHL